MDFPAFTETPGRPFMIGAKETVIEADPAPWAAQFASERAIVCRDVFAPPVFDRLFSGAQRATYRRELAGKVGTREAEDPQRIGSAINLLLQRTNLFRWLEQVTGRTGLLGAEGHLMQARAGAGDALDWHDDINRDNRALGITISFVDAPYSGGMFELRQVDDPASTRIFDHARAGTALIFDVSPQLEHRVLPVLSGGPRRVFGGWIMHGTVTLADRT